MHRKTSGHPSEFGKSGAMKTVVSSMTHTTLVYRKCGISFLQPESSQLYNHVKVFLLIKINMSTIRLENDSSHTMNIFNELPNTDR